MTKLLKNTCTHTHACTHAHIYTHACVHTHTYMLTHAYIHMCTKNSWTLSKGCGLYCSYFPDPMFMQDQRKNSKSTRDLCALQHISMWNYNYSKTNFQTCNSAQGPKPLFSVNRRGGKVCPDSGWESQSIFTCVVTVDISALPETRGQICLFSSELQSCSRRRHGSRSVNLTAPGQSSCELHPGAPWQYLHRVK